MPLSSSGTGGDRPRSIATAARQRAKLGQERVLDCWHRYLYKPYYLRSPKRLVHRLAGDLTASTTRLPWELPIRFQPGSYVGTKLARNGVHDLVLTETLCRITDPGDICVDVGANIGYTTSLLATCSGPGGRVISFEPAPDMFALLEANIESWHGAQVAEIDARMTAVSAIVSQVTLTTPAAHDGDVSARTLEHVDDGLESISVQACTLDASGIDQIGVLKVDVEGHELAVLAGCDRLLSEHKVRDIVFEEYREPPTAVTTRLAEAGYEVFRVEQGTGGPRLVRDIERRFAVYWDAPNYLATIDQARAIARLRRRGWDCLRMRR